MANKKNKYAGKFIIVFDTICDGNQCVTDEHNNPTLFDTANEAHREIFDGALAMLENRTPLELEEYNEGVTPELIARMKEIDRSGDVELMKIFLMANPNCNDNEEYVVRAEDFVLGRKAIYTGEGLIIIGEKLN